MQHSFYFRLDLYRTILFFSCSVTNYPKSCGLKHQIFCDMYIMYTHVYTHSICIYMCVCISLIKFTILIIFKCAVCGFTMLCKHHHYLSQNFFVFPTETLYPLNNNSLFYPSPSPGNHHSTFSLYEFYYTVSGIIQ